MYFGAIHTLSLRWQLLAWTVLVSLLFNGIFLIQYVTTDWGSNEAQDQVLIKPKGGLSFGAGMGILVIFMYYVFIKFGMSMGYSGIMSPNVAAWMGNVIFSIGGLLLLFLVRK